MMRMTIKIMAMKTKMVMMTKMMMTMTKTTQYRGEPSSERWGLEIMFTIRVKQDMTGLIIK